MKLTLKEQLIAFNASRIIGEGGFGPPSEKLGQMSGHMSGGACTLLRI